MEEDFDYDDHNVDLDDSETRYLYTKGRLRHYIYRTIQALKSLTRDEFKAEFITRMLKIREYFDDYYLEYHSNEEDLMDLNIYIKDLEESAHNKKGILDKLNACYEFLENIH